MSDTDMQAEIERLKRALALAGSELCKAAVGEIAQLEMDRLRALNAEMREALRAQMEVSVMHMRRAGFALIDIQDCTAQARAILAKTES